MTDVFQVALARPSKVVRESPEKLHKTLCYSLFSRVPRIITTRRITLPDISSVAKSLPDGIKRGRKKTPEAAHALSTVLPPPCNSH